MKQSSNYLIASNYNLFVPFLFHVSAASHSAAVDGFCLEPSGVSGVDFQLLGNRTFLAVQSLKYPEFHPT